MRIRLHLSNLCNFKCPNCHVFELGDNNLPNTLMSKNIFHQTVLKAIEYAKNNNEQDISFSIYGGEPLANFQLIKDELFIFKNKYDGINLFWSINTNGSLLTENDIIEMKKYQVDWHISVDGSEQIHNISRPTLGNKPTFHLVKKTLELLKKHQLNFQINSYMMPTNEDYLNGIIDIAIEFNCHRIYLDSFYDEKYQFNEQRIVKYFNAYLYALKNSIDLNGPWTRAHLLQIKYKSIDINIDGSFYFSDFPLKHFLKAYHEHTTDELNELFQQKKSEHLQFVDKNCQNCHLKVTCQGQGFLLYNYHLKKSVLNNSCNFYREMYKKLNRELLIIKEKSFSILLTSSICEISTLSKNIQNYILLFKKRTGLQLNPINFYIFDNFEEFNASISKTNIPKWVSIYTVDHNKIVKLGLNFNQTLLHELFHVYVLQNNLDLPQWLIEGYAEFIRDPEINMSQLHQSLKIGRFFHDCDLNSQEPDLFIKINTDSPETNFAYIQTKYFFQKLNADFESAKIDQFINESNKQNFRDKFLEFFNLSIESYCSNIGL